MTQPSRKMSVMGLSKYAPLIYREQDVSEPIVCECKGPIGKRETRSGRLALGAADCVCNVDGKDKRVPYAGLEQMSRTKNYETHVKDSTTLGGGIRESRKRTNMRMRMFP